MLPWLAIALVLVVAIILAAVVSSRRTPDGEPDVADVADDKASSSNERMPLLSDLEKLDLLREDPDRVKDLLPRHEGQYKRRKEYGLLQRNVDVERVDHGHTYMFVYTRSIDDKGNKMLHYDVDRTTGWSSLWHVSGSSFRTFTSGGRLPFTG